MNAHQRLTKSLASVIIPSYNAAEFLEPCLQSLIDSGSSRLKEVLVVDNASKDGSASMVSRKFPNVRVLGLERNFGFGKACNCGFEASSGDYVLFLNSDTKIFPGSLDRLCEILDEEPSVGILSPCLKGPDRQLLQMTWHGEMTLGGEARARLFSSKNIQNSALIRKWAISLQRQDRNVPSVVGAALMIRRSVFKQVGGFDENFILYFEETDLCKRVRQAGLNVRFTPRAEIVHYLGQSMKKVEAQTALLYRQSQIYYYEKHGSWLEKILLRLYLRIKFFRMYFSLGMKGERKDFYKKMRQVISGKIQIDL